jgi:uncharacterized repeat protein (TIGR01451 family)
MKKLTLLLYLLLFAGIANSQTITFEGTIFKNKLLESSLGNSIAKNSLDESMKIDANDDNEISQQEAILVYKLDVSQSSITNLVGLEYFINVRELECDQNDFETIDVSTLLYLTLLKVENNSNLLSIYAKNGTNEVLNFGGNTPNLVYICADESQISDLEDAGPGSPNYVVNEYCFLAPGGNHNKITGKIIFDSQANGVDASDVPHPNIKLKYIINGDKLQTVTDSSGDFVFYTKESGSFSLTPEIENSNWFTLTSSPVLGSFIDSENNVYNHNFYIVPIGVHQDVEVMIIPKSLSLVGLNASYDIMIKNKGNQSNNGQVQINYNQLQLGFLNASVPIANSVGQLIHSYENLLPFETRTFRINMNLTPLVLLNDIIQIAVSADSSAEELSTQDDNTFVYKQRVNNNDNLNAINCMEGSNLPTSEIGEYLHYTIDFENTGNQVAKNVTVKTFFDSAKYDSDTLQLLNSTLPYESKMENGESLFLFRNANLGGPGGSGQILLKIASNNDLPAGSTVTSEAEIFFDYESNVMPLITNTDPVSTTYQNLSVSINSFDNSIVTYPNPASSIITIDSKNTINSIQLFDMYGRLLQTNLNNATQVKMDVSQRASGTYFLKITSEKGQKVEKIVKE